MNSNYLLECEKVELTNTLFKTAFILTIVLYFIYSVLPSVFALISIINDSPVYFWSKLSEDTQAELSAIQIFGFFLVLATAPKRSRIFSAKTFEFKLSVAPIRFILSLCTLYASVIALYLLITAQGISDRNSLFTVAAGLSSSFALSYVYLISSIFVLLITIQKRTLVFLGHLIPYVIFDLISMGRVWIFSAIVLTLISYIIVKIRAPSKKSIFVIALLFGLLSVMRLGRDIFNIDIFSLMIYAFGEAFNTSQSIEIAYLSNTSVDLLNSVGVVAAEFMPAGIKSLAIDPDFLAINIIDSSKNAVYGGDIEMGFGSSWLAQAGLYFQFGWHLIFMPLLLSGSLYIARVVMKNSFFYGVIYLFFYMSGLFIFFRYGLNLSLSYPISNVINFTILLVFLNLLGWFKFVRHIVRQDENNSSHTQGFLAKLKE